MSDVERPDGIQHRGLTADMARERKRAILLTRVGEEAHGEVGGLCTFEECYQRAEVEIARMAQGPKPIHREAEPDRDKLSEGPAPVVKPPS